MNKNPKEAAAWKGRVLMKIWGFDEKKPKVKQISDFKHGEEEDPLKSLESRKWMCRAEVMNGSSLPKGFSKLKICI